MIWFRAIVSGKPEISLCFLASTLETASCSSSRIDFGKNFSMFYSSSSNTASSLRGGASSCACGETVWSWAPRHKCRRGSPGCSAWPRCAGSTWSFAWPRSRTPGTKTDRPLLSCNPRRTKSSETLKRRTMKSVKSLATFLRFNFMTSELVLSDFPTKTQNNR